MSGSARSSRGSRQGSAGRGHSQPGSGPNSPINPHAPRSTSNPQMMSSSGQGQYGSGPNSPSNTQAPRSTSNPQMMSGSGQGQPREGYRSFSDPRRPHTPGGRGSPTRPAYSPITPIPPPLSPSRPAGNQRSLASPRALSYPNSPSGLGRGSVSGGHQTLALRPATNDPPYPINRGYVCHTSWTPSQQQLAGGGVGIRAGDWGCILKCTDDKKLVYITITLKDARGWVPNSASHLNVGTTIYGRITLKGDFPIAPISFSITPNREVPAGLYPRTVYSFLTALGQEGHKLRVEDGLLNLVRSAHYRVELTKRMETCASRSRALAVLNKPDFSMRDLETTLIDMKNQLPENVQGTPGIYEQLTRLLNGEYYTRIGKAADLFRRSVGHDDDIKYRLTPFTTATNTALTSGGSYSMSPLLHGLDDDDARTLAETTTILQIGSYAPWLFEPSGPTTSPRTILDKLHAKFLTDLARPVFVSTGWVPATQRPNSGCTRGWNIATPLFEQRTESMIWSRTDSGAMATFRRSETIVDKTGVVLSLEYPTPTGKASFELTLGMKMLGKENYPAVGDEVLVVCEIMLDGQRHPWGWARLPEIAAWSDHNLAAGVAFKVQWYNRKAYTWMEKYLQTSTPRATGEVEASPRACSTAMAMRRYLLRQTLPDFQEKAPELQHGWQRDFGKLARVKRSLSTTLSKRSRHRISQPQRKA